jgi:hypothetical protein
MSVEMPWLLVVIVLLAVAAGLYKCSPDQKPKIQKRMETPTLVHVQVVFNTFLRAP